MKIAPVSADLLIKLAVVAAGLGAIWYVLNKASKTTSAAAAWVGETADNVVQAVNPLNDQNIFYTGANTITGGAANESIGTRLYDFFNPPEQDAAGNFEEIWGNSTPRNTGGATGSW